MKAKIEITKSKTTTEKQNVTAATVGQKNVVLGYCVRNFTRARIQVIF